MGCVAPLHPKNPYCRFEPVSSWRRIAVEFRTILRVAGMLHTGKLPTYDDLMGCMPGVKKGWHNANTATCWAYLMMAAGMERI